MIFCFIGIRVILAVVSVLEDLRLSVLHKNGEWRGMGILVFGGWRLARSSQPFAVAGSLGVSRVWFSHVVFGVDIPAINGRPGAAIHKFTAVAARGR